MIFCCFAFAFGSIFLAISPCTPLRHWGAAEDVGGVAGVGAGVVVVLAVVVVEVVPVEVTSCRCSSAPGTAAAGAGRAVDEGVHGQRGGELRELEVALAEGQLVDGEEAAGRVEAAVVDADEVAQPVDEVGQVVEVALEDEVDRQDLVARSGRPARPARSTGR